MASGSAAVLPPAGYETIRTTVEVGTLQIELYRVADTNRLCDAIDPARFDEDERFPYWAEPWPSAVALARFLVRRGLPRGVNAVELGCGTGLAGITAALLGARVLFTDFEEDALAFARSNHALNLGRPGRTRVVDWRAVPADLGAALVLAADVLYEKRFLQPFVRALDSVLEPGGTAYVAEPGRSIAEGTMEALENQGLERRLHLEEGRWAGRSYAVWVHEVRRPPNP